MDMRSSIIVLCILFISLSPFVNATGENQATIEPAKIHYTAAMLRSLSAQCKQDCTHTRYAFPERKQRKRGRRGGIKARNKRRKSRPFLPAVLFGNSRMLGNKLDELHCCTKWCQDYRDASAIAFVETWFHRNNTNDETTLDGFHLYRGDRTEESLKSKGGGVCIYINNRWAHANNATLVNNICTPDIEVLTVNIRPFYLPREFTNVVFNIVYIPPDANKTTATTTLHNIIATQDTRWPDAVHVILGDFNHATMDTIPHYTQYVTTPTRDKNILDLFYCNVVPDAYRSIPLPPLGNSDHRMISMIPKYRPVLKRRNVETRLIKTWTDEACDQLQACFDCTDWDLFKDTCADLDDLVFTVNSYIQFCEDLTIPQKTVSVYPNSKPWLTKECHEAIVNKKKLYRNYCVDDLATANKEIKKQVKACKKNYKEKIEKSFRSNDMSAVWKGMKKVTGYDCMKKKVNVVNESEFVDKLNQFYCRFDTHDFLKEHLQIRESFDNHHNMTCNMYFDENSVVKQFKSVKERKAPGPDNIGGKIMKTCAEQLAAIFTYIFNQSIISHHIPTTWKLSKILPVPKKSKISEMNDLRPVALTSIVFKCFEKLVLKELVKEVKEHLDPLQFAYKEKRNTEDALLFLLDNIYSHLDIGKSFVRVLFVDFSSAFNTIQPHLMFQKLNNLHINPFLSSWLFEFLTQRTQFVDINNTVSSILTTNTGAPQGCVLSPVLYTLYTNDFIVTHKHVHLLKFADDSAIVGLSPHCGQDYFNIIQSFYQWCNNNYLLLNVKKTKELIFDFRKTTKEPTCPLIINDEEVEAVTEIKYLGIMIDNRLNWQAHFNSIYKKANQRMYFLRKLNAINIDKGILKTFYTMAIQSVLTYGVACWGGNILQKEKNKINVLIKKASKICNVDLPHLDELYTGACIKKATCILSDSQHPLNKEYQRSARSLRLLTKKTKTERYYRSFVPSSSRML